MKEWTRLEGHKPKCKKKVDFTVFILPVWNQTKGKIKQSNDFFDLDRIKPNVGVKPPFETI